MIIGPRNGVPATRASRGAPRGDDRSPDNRWLRFAKTAIGFVLPKCTSLSCPGRSAARSGALQTRDRSSLWRSRISDAPLADARAASHPGHTIRTIPVFSCFSADSESSIPGLTISSTRTPPRSRGAFAPGVCILLRQPGSRGGRSAEKRSGACEAPVGHAITRRVRRLRGALRPIARQDARERAYDAGRSPLGAPPWRFWALGPRFRLPHYTGAAQRAPRSQVVVPGGRGPAPPEASGYEPPPQDATPRSAFRIVSRTRPQ
jgi:hypothetical protein